MRSLLKFGYNKYSQAGEDGILEEIFKRLNIEKGIYVDVGAHDGLHMSNTENLREKDWRGLCIEADRGRFNLCVKNTEKYKNITKYLNKTIKEDELDFILDKYEFIDENFDYLDIDIDGFDYHVWKNLNEYKPKVVQMEIIERIPLGVEQINDENHWLTSFSSMLKLGIKKGYKLVSYTGLNMIFVRNDLANIIPEEELNNPNENIYFRGQELKDYRKHINEMKTIKFISDTPHHPKQKAGWTWYRMWRRMAKDYDSYTWNKIKVVTPEEKADYNIIVNHPDFKVKEDFDRSKTITFQLEPKVVRQNAWGEYNNPQLSNGFLYCHNIDNNHMCVDWNIEINYQTLKNTDYSKKKSKILSTVQTYKEAYPGHRLRKPFLQKYLDNLECCDIYGHLKQGEDHTYKRYKGELPVRKKEEALIPYKYSFCCENSKEKNYWTEKISDALLCECLPFYWGCPNLTEFLPEKCFIWLPMEDPEKAIKIIKESIKNNEWEKRLPHIKEAKRRILDHWNFFPDLQNHLIELGEL